MKTIELAVNIREASISLASLTYPTLRQKALASMTIFPLIMLVSYIVIWFYFKSKGGYKPVSLSDGH